MSLLEVFNQKQLQARPKVRPGDVVRVYQKDPTKESGKSQVFEGVVIARRHGFGKTASIVVRRESGDVAVEKIYPIHSPVVEKIEVIQRSQVHRAKLYYLREASGKRARLKRKAVDLDKIEYTQESQAPQEAAAEEKKEASEAAAVAGQEAATNQDEPQEAEEK